MTDRPPPTVADVARFLGKLAPPARAADWDNVGLLAGDPTGPAGRILTCLTVTPDVAAEAVAERVGLVVAHHPVLFRGAKRLTPDTPDGRVLLPLLRAGAAVYSAHTAYDDCPDGVNDGLCRRLGLARVEPLRPADGPRQYKLAVFVPDADLGRVSDAAFAAGAGVIGKYEQCSFRLAGTGTFFGTESADPAVGRKGRREEVAEWQVETVVPADKLSAVVAAVRAAHSYEEPAFDVYPLAALPTGGAGRVGDLPAAVPLRELADRVKGVLAAGFVHTVGDPDRAARRVAVACGAAGEFLADAIRAKADVFLTGELRYHECVAAESAGLAAVLPGHYASERPGVEDLAAALAAEFPAAAVWASRRERDPIR